jgi:hypothetical protein
MPPSLPASGWNGKFQAVGVVEVMGGAAKASSSVRLFLEAPAWDTAAAAKDRTGSTRYGHAIESERRGSTRDFEKLG